MIRFRAILLLLAFGLGISSQFASVAAMAAETAKPDRIIGASGAECPGSNANDRQCATAAGCIVSCERAMPGIISEGVPSAAAVDAAFAFPAQMTLSGGAARPEPYPPRS